TRSMAASMIVHPASCTPHRRSLPEDALTRSSVSFKRALVILFQCRILVFLSKEAIAHRQRFDGRAHEAAEGIFGRADDRLSAHVEAGVDQHRASSPLFEESEKPVIARVGLAMDGLNARGVVDVSDRGNLGPRHVQLVDPE